MYRERFVKNLKNLCKDKPISQLAKEIGMPGQTLANYLHNLREISLENLCIIADYFGESLDFLAGRDKFIK